MLDGPEMLILMLKDRLKIKTKRSQANRKPLSFRVVSDSAVRQECRALFSAHSPQYIFAQAAGRAMPMLKKGYF